MESTAPGREWLAVLPLSVRDSCLFSSRPPTRAPSPLLSLSLSPACSLCQTKCKHPLLPLGSLFSDIFHSRSLSLCVLGGLSFGKKRQKRQRKHTKHQMAWLMNNANEAFSTSSLFKALTATYSHPFFLIPVFPYRSKLPLLWGPWVCSSPYSASSQGHSQSTFMLMPSFRSLLAYPFSSAHQMWGG